jgi:transcriptional regulator with XRE-family HTH domain
MTQQELADKLSVTKQAVSKWENDKGLPDITLFEPLALHLDLPIDTLIGQSKRYRKKVLFAIFSLVCTLMVIIILSFHVISNIETQRFVKGIEESVLFNLPTAQRYKSFDFKEFTMYGNTFNITKMSYVIFRDNHLLRDFKNDITQDIRWTPFLNEEQVTKIPSEIQSYITLGNYFMLYNLTDNTYQSEICSLSSCQYILLIYQDTYRRLIVFQYNL